MVRTAIAMRDGAGIFWDEPDIIDCERFKTRRDATPTLGPMQLST